MGDKRRNERFVSIINGINKQPGSSIPKRSESWYEAKATYNFFSNANITIPELQKAIKYYGGNKVKGLKKVLAAHDFCQVSYNNLAAVELGYRANNDGRGIITYNSIAISEDGIPLSLQYQQTFLRPLEDLGKAKLRKEIPFEDKESYYWYKGITKVNGQLSNELHKIHIADREADIYDLFFCAFETNTDLLIRAKHNRKLDGGSALWDSVGQQDAAVTMELQIPDKTGNKRVPITVEVRYHNVEILRPKDSGSGYESVCMSAIELKQVSPKGGMAGRIIALETADNTKR